MSYCLRTGDYLSHYLTAEELVIKCEGHNGIASFLWSCCFFKWCTLTQPLPFQTNRFELGTKVSSKKAIVRSPRWILYLLWNRLKMFLESFSSLKNLWVVIFENFRVDFTTTIILGLFWTPFLVANDSAPSSVFLHLLSLRKYKEGMKFLL